MSSTIAEKVLARASGSDSVSPHDHVMCDVDVAMAHDHGLLEVMDRFASVDVDEVWDPSRIVCPMDHHAPSHTVEDANSKSRIRRFVKEHGIESFYEVGTGISHELLVEKGHAKPGQLIVGTDSHTTSLGVVGAAGTGVGYTDMTHVFATGRTWFRVPESIKIELTGEFGAHVTSKDVMLYIAGELGTDFARYCSVEYTGEAVEEMSFDDRFTLTNMAIELGAKFGFTPVDRMVTEYVRERTTDEFEPLVSDPDAAYRETVEIDVSEIGHKVAVPHKVGNVVDVEEVAGTNVDQVFIGSCTNGKYDDLKAAAEVLEGNRVDDDTRMIITPASREILSRAERSGLLRVFNDAGAMVTNATCGACIGYGLGVLGDGEVCLAAQNRNFKGRMGSNSSEIYVSNPAVAAASAIRGEIAAPGGS